ncbi:hypothetical protein AXF42_Ash016693 [Apostasia shenzhenica]|uniref:Uncharacterized protein n=1 Tax=Apostasia shenzhenica TaxID=1088818 RepID=A0A2I0AQ12_9ASPA|nr:hypothetical protein AXF42_Ash016693 [Apostasia shenzhenica]
MKRGGHTDDIGNSSAVSVPTGRQASGGLEVDAVWPDVCPRQRRQVVVVARVDEGVSENEASSQAFFSSHSSCHGAYQQE